MTGAVQTQINTMVDGKPGYVVSDNCTYIVNAKKGGYCYLKDGDTIDKKSIYSHISDAEQYMLLKMGYGKKLVQSSGQGHKSVQANTNRNIFAQKRQSRAQARISTILSKGRRG